MRRKTGEEKIKLLARYLTSYIFPDLLCLLDRLLPQIKRMVGDNGLVTIQDVYAL